MGRAPPGFRAVYSIQQPAVWDELKRTGRYELGDTSLFEAPGFDPAYAWMRDQLRVRLGVGTASCWPVWGLTWITRTVLAAACRRSAGQVLFRLQVPTSDLLESDFDGCHAALNVDPLYPPEVSFYTGTGPPAVMRFMTRVDVSSCTPGSEPSVES